MPEFDDIVKRIEKSIKKFNKGVPSIQKGMLDAILEEVRKLELNSGRIKPTMANIKRIASIKAKINSIILTDNYVAEVKDFVKAFKAISILQVEYWKTVDKKFDPPQIVEEITKQAVEDTITKLTESGITVNIGDNLTEILRANVTSGGSYNLLENQLRESLTDTKKSDGLLSKYAKNITVTSLNTYNRQYTQVVASALKAEWYAYQGSEIMTSRPFCQSMVEERRYFHVSEVPALLRAEGMYYTDNKDEQRKKVPIYSRTGLPAGMIEGTNAENFFIRAGGHGCGHQIRPVSEALVPLAIRDRVYSTDSYQAWKGVQVKDNKPTKKRHL